MTEDQVSQLSAMGRDVAHILAGMDDLRKTIGTLATKDEVAAMVTRRDHDLLGYRVETIERTIPGLQAAIKEQSASSLLERTTKVAVAITAVAAAVGVVFAVAAYFIKG
jgi:hypothetical protein